MKHKNLFVTLSGYFLFFIFLFFATDIVVAMPMKEMHHIKKIDPTQYNQLSKKFVVAVESFSEKGDIFFTVEFSGFAFIKTGQESSNKAIKLVFISKEDSYEVDTLILERFTYREYFNKNGIVGTNHNYITKFSPLNMKNGVYNLYIYCYENENTIGFTSTNMMFEKTYRSFKRIK